VTGGGGLEQPAMSTLANTDNQTKGDTMVDV
jgi:hypothetical protein